MCFPFIEEVIVAFGVFEEVLFVMELFLILIMGVIAAVAIFVIEFFRGIFSLVEISPRIIYSYIKLCQLKQNDCIIEKILRLIKNNIQQVY